MFPVEYLESTDFNEDWNDWRELQIDADFDVLTEKPTSNCDVEKKFASTVETGLTLFTEDQIGGSAEESDHDDDDALNDAYRAAYLRFRAELGSKQQKKDVPFERFVFYVCEAQAAGMKAALDPTGPDPATDFLPEAHLCALRMSGPPHVPEFFSKMPTVAAPTNESIDSDNKSARQRREQKRKELRKKKKALTRNQSSTSSTSPKTTQAPAMKGILSIASSCNRDRSVSTTTTNIHTTQAPAMKGTISIASSCNRETSTPTSVSPQAVL